MSARDTIAEALLPAITEGRGRRIPDLPQEWQDAYRNAPTFRDGSAAVDALYAKSITDAVIAAVRSMPVEDQAELIGGITQTDAAGTVARVVGLWQEAPQ